MNSFVVKAIILSAIVAYYGQCEGGWRAVDSSGGKQCFASKKLNLGVTCCGPTGQPVCSGLQYKFGKAKNYCKNHGGLCSSQQLVSGLGSPCAGLNWVKDYECDGGHPASSNSRESISAPMAVATSTGAEDSGFDVVSAMIGIAVGAVLMLLTVYIVHVVRRKRKIAKLDEEAMVTETEEVQETPANVVTVETVIETEME